MTETLFTLEVSREPQTATQARDKALRDHEEWRDVPGYESRYSVSNHGRVWLKRYRRISRLKPGRGYFFFVLSKANKQATTGVHRLVMLAFQPIPNADELHVNHIDGNRGNNHISNLEWATPLENNRHSYYVLGNKNLPPVMRGREHCFARPVRKINPDGSIAKEYPSIVDAVAEGYSACCITEVCRGRQGMHRGFYWQYASAPKCATHGADAARLNFKPQLRYPFATMSVGESFEAEHAQRVRGAANAFAQRKDRNRKFLVRQHEGRNSATVTRIA